MCSLPVAAEESLLLAGTSSESTAAADGVAECLARYQALNNAMDESEGINIVQNPDLSRREICEVALPAWLSGSTSTADIGRQAAPMVLNLENVLHSTPEVLERELEKLSLTQMVQIRDAIIPGIGN
eukprot:gene9950-10105_t